ncbi:hypothetical protein K445DRAFT_151946 [Daldinia sp. EC12]|nr:hypothetical protein K445DRAFT_151946 [Daldinia sp. EC12]
MRPRKRIMITVSVAWMEGGKTSQIPFLFCIAARHLLFLTNCSHKHLHTQLNTYSIHFVPAFLEELVSTSTLGVISKTGGNFLPGNSIGRTECSMGIGWTSKGKGPASFIFSLAFWLLTFVSLLCCVCCCPCPLSAHMDGIFYFLPARERGRRDGV